MGLAALAGLFLFWRERNKRKHLEQEIPEKNPNEFAAFSSQYTHGPGHQQNGYGQVQQDGMGEERGPKPPAKTYEMSSERRVELPAGHGQHELVNPEYGSNEQQGAFREGI